MTYSGIACPSWCNCSVCNHSMKNAQQIEFDRKHNKMIEDVMNGIDYRVDFGSKVVEIQCPECDQVYHIAEKDIQEGKVTCWNNWDNNGRREYCGSFYFQKYQKTSEIQFVRKAVHTVKGH